MIPVTCPCGGRFQTRDEHAGKRTKCPTCGSPLVVPAAAVGAEPAKPPQPQAAPPAWWHPKDGSSGGGPPLTQTSGSGNAIPAAKSNSSQSSSSLESAKGSRIWDQRTRSLALMGGGAGVLVLACVLYLGFRFQGPTAGVPTKDPGSVPNAPGSQTTTVVPAPGKAPLDRSTGADSDRALPKTTLAKDDQPRLRILVPAYFYPSGEGLKDWERLIAAAADVPIVAIANPSTGPGEAANADYLDIIRRAALRGVVVIGYVGTQYARRPSSEVKADIDRWIRFYPNLGGIFLDAQEPEGKQVEYYAALREYIRQKLPHALVVTNPGTVCAEGFASRPASDVMCMFSSPTGFENFSLPQWTGRYDSSRFAVMVSQVANKDALRQCVLQAILRGIGTLYVTDARVPNNWDRLPSFWDAEIDAVRRVNRHEAP